MYARDVLGWQQRIRWVAYRNDASEQVPAFGLLRVTGFEFDGPKQLFACAKPNTDFQRFYLINGSQPVDAGKYGVATLDPTYASYATGDGTPAVGEAWGAKHSEWKLSKNRPGFTVLGGVSSGTMLVAPQQVDSLIGKLDGSLTRDSSATMSIWFGAAGSEADSTLNVTVRGWLIPTGETLASGARVVCQWINGYWYVIAADECTE